MYAGIDTTDAAQMAKVCKLKRRDRRNPTSKRADFQTRE
jgi:hypothetical protein